MEIYDLANLVKKSFYMIPKVSIDICEDFRINTLEKLASYYEVNIDFLTTISETQGKINN